MAQTKKSPAATEKAERKESVLHMNIDPNLLRDVKVVAAMEEVLMRDWIARVLRDEVSKKLPASHRNSS